MNMYFFKPLDMLWMGTECKCTHAGICGGFLKKKIIYRETVMVCVNISICALKHINKAKREATKANFVHIDMICMVTVSCIEAL